MSTRATISAVYSMGNMPYYKGVYLHFDGYIASAGKTLFKHYTKTKKIERLINSGCMSSLGKKIKKCKFYKDMGEDAIIVCSDRYATIMDSYPDAEYHYLWVADENQWYVTMHNGEMTQLMEHFIDPRLLHGIFI